MTQNNYSIAQVAIALPLPGPFDYEIPAAMRKRISVGDRVIVPFGHTQRLGFVIALQSSSSVEHLKSILHILDSMPLISTLNLACSLKMSQHYGCSQGEALEMMLPTLARKNKTIECAPMADRVLVNTQRKVATLLHTHSLISHWSFVVKSIREVLDRRQSVLILVPESSQIIHVQHHLKAVLTQPTVIHDNLRSDRDELKHWIELKEGKVKIVIGIRSAVFAPLVDLGLIVMFDEENAAYKEEQTPFYHAREIVWLRHHLQSCDVLFVSKTPSIELMQVAIRDRYELVDVAREQTLNKQLIDMTNFSSKGPMLISFVLRTIVQKSLAESRKMLLLINRRGLNTLTKCLYCGYVLRCERCDTSLSFVSSKKLFECRRCLSTKKPLNVCPKCHKNYLRSQGVGVERVVQEVKRLFPQARVESYDGQSPNFPKRFDVLVATQAVFRMTEEVAFDYGGVIDIDQEFNRVDFRSSIKVFSLLSNLELITKQSLFIQTYHVDNEVLRDFVSRTYRDFYRREIKLREELKLPPYFVLTALRFRSKDQKLVLTQATLVYNWLVENKSSDVQVVNMQPDVVAKLRDQFRYTIILRSRTSESVLNILKNAQIAVKKKSGVIVTTEVDGVLRHERRS